MKRFLIIFAVLVCAINANAQFRFKSLDNNDGKTTIVIVDDNFKAGTEICCAKFNNDGKTYEARSMVTAQEGDAMSVTMTFKRMTVFNNMSVTLTVNGQQVNTPLEIAEVAGQLAGYKLLVP